MKEISTAYLINFPKIDDTIEAFSFAAAIPDGTFEFLFKWINGAWSCWVTLPSGEIRSAGCIPGVMNWAAFLDFGLIVLSSLTAVGQTELTSTSLVIAKWV